MIYSKSCLTHTDTVVHYLARYSHRIALTDGRIVNRDGSRHKIMTLAGEELIRRFLLHVLSKGLHADPPLRLSLQPLPHPAHRGVAQQPCEASTEAESPVPFDSYPCPLCRKGRLRITAHLAPRRFNGGPTTDT